MGRTVVGCGPLEGLGRGRKARSAPSCIDDASESGDNDITGSEDELTFIRADTPVQVARAFALAQAVGGRFQAPGALGS